MLRVDTESIGSCKVARLAEKKAWKVSGWAEALGLYRTASTTELVEDASESPLDNKKAIGVLRRLRTNCEGLAPVLHTR